jgi:glycerol-3-phosphate dehydrogenase (NAD(P)+)
MSVVAILGAGSWGTALAAHLGRVGHDVRLWARDASVAAEIARQRTNTPYLPGIELPASVLATEVMATALDGATIVVAAVPSHGCRAVVQAAAPHLGDRVPLVSAIKGLEVATLMRMSEVIAQELGERFPVVVLSGPSFAMEVARQLPTAVLAASSDPHATALVQREFRGPTFRLYGSSDVVGVEVAGAMKNVIAIAAGVVEGLGLGHNALAALVTRGLAEITRLACAAGGRRETAAGLSGLGDLVLTCTGSLSRNRFVGIELARGRQLTDVVAGMRMVAEGVKSTHAVLALGERYGVELPIAAQMASVLEGRVGAAAAVGALMLRPQRSETEGT